MSEIIDWQEPPERVIGGTPEGRWQACAKELQRRPGEWALVLKGGTKTQAFSVWQRLGKRWGAKTTRRQVGPDTFDVYAKWPES